MNYREALAWLYGTQRFGIKLGLENAERLFAALRIPSPEHRIVHVAGTNGKGSVCAMAAAICRAEGYRTGLFTSPHLVTFRERIQINGEMISEQGVAEGLTMMRELVRHWDPHPTFFEITTGLGLLHFRNQQCDVVILETGLGGRLDATNAVLAKASAITPIGIDHQEWLGSSLAEIAREKAGIIKGRIPVVSARQAREAEEIIRARAAACEAPLTWVAASYGSSPVGLFGEHQKQNAALAIAALRAAEIRLSQNSIETGLAEVSWPARFQQWDERLVIDGAHNETSALVLAQTWREVFGDENAHVIFGSLRDKDVAAMWRALAPIADLAFLPKFSSQRAFPAAEARAILATTAPGLTTAEFPSIALALAAARKRNGRILLTGSLHFAGEALALLHGGPAAFEECTQ